MNFKWNSHQLNTYIYLSASVIDFRKQYDQLLVILGLSRYQTTGRFPGWKIHIQILPSQCICISDKSLNLYSLITVTRSYRNYTCFPFNRSTFSVSDLFLRDLPFSDSLYFLLRNEIRTMLPSASKTDGTNYLFLWNCTYTITSEKQIQPFFSSAFLSVTCFYRRICSHPRIICDTSASNIFHLLSQQLTLQTITESPKKESLLPTAIPVPSPDR